jgi:hypothetical protein
MRTHTGYTLNHYGFPYHPFNSTLGLDGVYFSYKDNPHIKIPSHFLVLPPLDALRDVEREDL